ncbi:ENV1 protein, partial [Chionis minor]|nr:ENV1 protein [Chionis minor]
TTLEENPLWNLMNISFQILNKTYPNLTQPCWLCYDARPPYYEAVGIDKRPAIINGSNPGLCKWGNNTQGISMSQVTGKGICFG